MSTTEVQDNGLAHADKVAAIVQKQAEAGHIIIVDAGLQQTIYNGRNGILVNRREYRIAPTEEGAGVESINIFTRFMFDEVGNRTFRGDQTLRGQDGIDRQYASVDTHDVVNPGVEYNRTSVLVFQTSEAARASLR